VGANNKKGDAAMTRGFEQQDRSVNFTLPKSAPSPQHGQKGDPKAVAPTRPSRSPEPRPGH
jgi:hypothetical protein